MYRYIVIVEITHTSVYICIYIYNMWVLYICLHVESSIYTCIHTRAHSKAAEDLWASLSCRQSDFTHFERSGKVKLTMQLRFLKWV